MADRFPEIAGPPENGEDSPLWKKLAWFAALSMGGLLAVAGLAYVLRGALLIAQ
ncbi:MAG: DUF2474 domain-containing protein [Pseudomonadota bacterium]